MTLKSPRLFQRLRSTRRGFVTGVVGTIGIALAAPVLARRAVAADELSGVSKTAPSSGAAAAAQRQREGATIVDVAGHFKMSGDRATFFPLDSPLSYAGLENLNLERVTLVISENPDQSLWSVSGTITEFRGSNYILISKAVMRARRDSAEPASPRSGVAPRVSPKSGGPKEASGASRAPRGSATGK